MGIGTLVASYLIFEQSEVVLDVDVNMQAVNFLWINVLVITICWSQYREINRDLLYAEWILSHTFIKRERGKLIDNKI